MNPVSFGYPSVTLRLSFGYAGKVEGRFCYHVLLFVETPKGFLECVIYIYIYIYINILYMCISILGGWGLLLHGRDAY